MIFVFKPTTVRYKNKTAQKLGCHAMSADHGGKGAILNYSVSRCVLFNYIYAYITFIDNRYLLWYLIFSCLSFATLITFKHFNRFLSCTAL